MSSMRLADTTRALVERVRELEDMQRATFNVADDLEDGRRLAERTHRATLNILEDLDEERRGSVQAQRATVNILEDLSDAKERTDAVNQALQTEIARRQKAEEAMVANEAELKRSNDELQQFAYVASHDMQEPLRTVTGAVTRLSRRYKSIFDAEAEEYMRFALEGTARMQRLIEDLLAFSRVGTRGAAPAEVGSQAALARALQALQGTIEDAGANVTQDALPRVIADEGQLSQVFQNLVGNAIKFRGEQPSRVHVGARSKGPMVEFYVQDNGIGIAPEYHERIFVIFQRLHAREAYPGTGIGLAICRKIVERHGGRIWVESTPGAGATFRFTFPAAKEGDPHVDP